MRYLSVIIFLSFLLVAGCAPRLVQPRLLEETAKLDQVYIPALFFTELEKQRESEVAVERFKNSWARFYGNFHTLEIKYGLDITDKFWEDDFERMNDLAAKAEAMVHSKKLDEAHGSLEDIREILRELRHRNGLEYFLDGMTEFHAYMEVILIIADGSEELREGDLDNLRALFKEAQRSWSEISRSAYDLLIFGFDEEKIKAIKMRTIEEEMLLAQFAAALSTKDENKLYEAAQNLKPNFVMLYKAFGDFDPIFLRIKEENNDQQDSELDKKASK